MITANIMEMRIIGTIGLTSVQSNIDNVISPCAELREHVVETEWYHSHRPIRLCVSIMVKCVKGDVKKCIAQTHIHTKKHYHGALVSSYDVLHEYVYYVRVLPCVSMHRSRHLPTTARFPNSRAGECSSSWIEGGDRGCERLWPEKVR